MTTYQGPHASVLQQFVTSPASIAIENLPPTIVATAYDVFKEQDLGSYYGIKDVSMAWVDDDGTAVDSVVYDRNVVGRRGYDFYPPTGFANASVTGMTGKNVGAVDMEVLAASLSSSGIAITLDDDFSLPNVARAVGSSQAFMPYYRKNATAVDTGTSTGTGTALVEAGQNFETTIEVGDLVFNSTQDATALVTVVVSDTTLTLDTSIMVSGDSYTIYRPIKIIAGSLNTIIIPDGAVATAKLQPDQAVYSLVPGTVGTWTYMGVVGSIGADETKIILKSAYSAAFNGSAIIVGSANTGANILTSDTANYGRIEMPNTIYDPDPTTDFEKYRVAEGDVIHFSSLSISGSTATPLQATVTKVINNKTLRINTELLDQTGLIDSDFYKYKAQVATPGSTVLLSSYDIKRYIGFGENYNHKAYDSAAGVPISSTVGSSSFKIARVVDSVTITVPRVNDIVAIFKTNPTASANEREAAGLLLYRIKTVTTDATHHLLTFDEVLSTSDVGGVIVDTDSFVCWRPMIESDITSDFRAVRDEEAGVVHRITQPEDIFTYYMRDGEETIDPWNELQFMLNIALGRSGNKVCYAVNVDASAANLSTEYANAFEELSLIDSYSHALGTTDASVNGLAPTYCNSQAEPYEGHEKIAILGYDQEDVFLQGLDTGSNTSGGLITISGAFSTLTAGITIGDTVKIYDASGDYVEEVTVTTSPTASTQVQTDGETVHAAGHSYRFLSGRKADQASRIGLIGSGVSERRATVVWPGWFSATYDGESITVPPYFITAAIAGMDSGVLVSQSFTNMPFSIPGLTNLTLGTNFFYRKSQLDVIGGGGVDVMIQDTEISTNIKSRHDLTSNMDSVEYRERSITKQADVAAKTIRSAVAPYVGRYNITDSLYVFLGQVCSIAGTKLKRDSIISNLNVTSIQRDEVITDKINFFITATVFVAGNYYDITLTVVSR